MVVVAGILIAIMIVTTYLTSRQMILKTGWATDPTQLMMQRLMLYGIPVSLLVSGSIFPIGAVIYYVTTNLFSLGQQFYVLRKFPPPPMRGHGPRSRTDDQRQGRGPRREAVQGRRAGAKAPAKSGSRVEGRSARRTRCTARKNGDRPGAGEQGGRTEGRREADQPEEGQRPPSASRTECRAAGASPAASLVARTCSSAALKPPVPARADRGTKSQ